MNPGERTARVWHGPGCSSDAYKVAMTRARWSPLREQSLARNNVEIAASLRRFERVARCSVLAHIRRPKYPPLTVAARLIQATDAIETTTMGKPSDVLLLNLADVLHDVTHRLFSLFGVG